LWKSRDGGSNWADASAALPSAIVWALAADPKRAGTLYAVNGEANRYPFPKPEFPFAIARSTDAAATWEPLGLKGDSIVAPSESSPRIYSGADRSVQFSDDGGKTWVAGAVTVSGDISLSLAAFSIISLAVAPSVPSTIYAGVDADMDYCESPIYRSTDAGKTWLWTTSDNGLPCLSAFSLVVDPSSADRVIAATSKGVFSSTDGGETWARTFAQYARVAVADPTDAATIYIGTESAGVQVSRDRGAHWSALNEGLGNLSVLALAIDATGRHLYAGTRSGVFAYDVTLGPLDVAATPAGGTGFLSMPSANRIVLGNVNSSGGALENSSYGPYDGWTPRALAGSSDGLDRVLWTNGDGRWDVWLVGPGGVLGSFLFPADPDLAPADVASGFAGDTHVLAKGAGGAAVWGIDARGVRTGTVHLGSYPGWIAAGISDGADGLSRVLWNNDDGRSGLSLVSSGAIVATARYDAEPGWTSTDLAVGGDGMTRILRTQADGRIAVWIADGTGAIVARGPVYSAPAGSAARHIASGADGSARILFSDSGPGSVVWLLSPDGVLEGSFELD